MPPLRFKWVNTETGEEYQNNDVSLHFKPLNSIGEPIPGFSGKLLSKVPQWLSKVITENVSKPCQSTGLTDANGNEVFERDMIVYNYPAHATHPDRWPGGQNFFQISYSEGGFRFSNCMLTILAKPTFDNDQNHVSQAVLKKSVVIGNAWMSYKELKSMAEAVSNEGVKRE